ncbi:hypothetical protein KJ819_02575 [Patescibacteria group bacterium]|nr:hypothetical protein [Patescibacteria group bacterium]MBU1500833.1 hypothetical protein [Patescibacteria group bacterium]MBU2080888.1 hypothetical protein [Patescibacteria group bacterium]MBU2123993.1 hypothetical protein [Patescibacteria group bacterium]MBU2194716.1 hypothetical protein [Patescibacteria group bacterium]
MAILSERTWERHANPWSGWTRALSMPALAVGLYFHSFWILGATIIWLIVNPMLFPKPISVDNWMSKGVLGEQLYYKDGKKLKKDLPTLLNILNVPTFAAFLYFSWQQEILIMIFAGLLAMTLKFWFIDRMVRITDSTG